jgi:hypothetical protein
VRDCICFCLSRHDGPALAIQRRRAGSPTSANYFGTAGAKLPLSRTTAPSTIDHAPSGRTVHPAAGIFRGRKLEIGPAASEVSPDPISAPALNRSVAVSGDLPCFSTLLRGCLDWIKIKFLEGRAQVLRGNETTRKCSAMKRVLAAQTAPSAPVCLRAAPASQRTPSPASPAAHSPRSDSLRPRWSQTRPR